MKSSESSISASELFLSFSVLHHNAYPEEELEVDFQQDDFQKDLKSSGHVSVQNSDGVSIIPSNNYSSDGSKKNTSADLSTDPLASGKTDKKEQSLDSLELRVENSVNEQSLHAKTEPLEIVRQDKNAADHSNVPDNQGEKSEETINAAQIEQLSRDISRCFINELRIKHNKNMAVSGPARAEIASTIKKIFPRLSQDNKTIILEMFSDEKKENSKRTKKFLKSLERNVFFREF